MKAAGEMTLLYRKPTRADGAAMWALVRESGTLDLNSPYCYIMLGEWFAGSCRLALDPHENRLIGMVTGFRQPADPCALFVWQIAVHPHYRGRGIARRLLDELTAEPDIRTVEATVSPSNHASGRLFRNWAASRNASLKVEGGFGETDFPEGRHEREALYHIILKGE